MPIEGLEATRAAVGEEHAMILISQGRQMSRKQVLNYVMSWNPAGLRGGAPRFDPVR
jgi:hypothetical protein